MARIALDLLPQTPHEDVNRAWSHKRAFFPHRVKQLIASEDAAAVARQIFEKAEFAHRGEHGLARDAHRHGSDVDLQLSQLDLLVSRSFRSDAEHVADTGKQFARTEGFGDVSVAADVKRLQAVGFLGSGGKKNDGSLGQLFVLANLAAEIEAADAGQHN